MVDESIRMQGRMNKQTVVVLHGIFQPAFTMRSMCRYLEADGFRVVNVDYPSTSHPIETLAEIVNNRLSRETQPDDVVHFVGFSMGGLVIRAMMKRGLPVKQGRVVMIGTPNHGSALADVLKDFSPYKRLFGPAGQQLVTDQSALRGILADDGFEVGVIAGDRPGNPLYRRILGASSDGKVALSSAIIENAADVFVAHRSHRELHRDREVMRQTAAFLHSGRFGKSTEEVSVHRPLLGLWRRSKPNRDIGAPGSGR